MNDFISSAAEGRGLADTLPDPPGPLGESESLTGPARQMVLEMEAWLFGPSSTLERSERTPTVPLCPPGYEGLEELGRGGFGVVYKARQLSPPRVVALKMLKGLDRDSSVSLNRFRVEAEAIARLNHPNIVSVYQFGEWHPHEGAPALHFFSMEFVDGGGLDRKLAVAPLSSTEAAALVRDIAAGVRHAHERGVVHRDLKPGNILLASGGRESSADGLGGSHPPLANLIPKITDFGLARRLDMKGDTASLAVLGTPSYMSPEQASGLTSEAGPLADVYSLGAILYECLTGRPPFGASDLMETLRQVREDDPVPPRRLQPSVPRDLEIICLKCLRKEPEKRYGSAGELAQDLTRLLSGESIQARPVSGAERLVKWVRRRPAVAALLAVSFLALVASVVGGTVFALKMKTKNAELNNTAQRLDKEKQRAERAVYVTKVREAHRLVQDNRPWVALELLNQLRPNPGEEDQRDVAWHVVHAAATSDGLQILAHLQPITSIAYAPDGLSVATVSGDAPVTLWNTETGQHRFNLIGHTGHVYQMEFAPDGQRLATISWDGFCRIWSAKDGRLVKQFELQRDSLGGWVVWSRDGKYLATRGANQVLHVFPVEEGQRKEWKAPAHTIHTYGWSSRGILQVAVAEADNTIGFWDTEKNSRLSKTTFKSTATLIDVGFSPDGGRLATAWDDGFDRVFNVQDGKECGEIRWPSSGRRRLVWSPDGRLLASSDGEVRLWDWKEGKVERPFPKMQSCFAFSPDGKILAGQTFAPKSEPSQFLGPAVLVLAPVSPPPTLPVPKNHFGLGRIPARQVVFSPDGKELLSLGDDMRGIIWNTATGKTRHELKIAPNSGFAASWSFDGALIATVDSENFLGVLGKKPEALGTLVRVWNADDCTNRSVLKHEMRVNRIAFRPRGRQLATASLDGWVRLWDVDSQTPVHSWQLAGTLAFSADGKQLATGGVAHPIRLWDPDKEALLQTLSESQGALALAFSRDGKYIAAGLTQGYLKVWDLETGETQVNRQYHINPIAGLSYSPDGRTLATAALDGVRVWDTLTGQELLHFPEIQALDVNWSPDGRMLAAAGEYGQVRLWRWAGHPPK